MSKYFNEYGNPIRDGKINKIRQKVEKIINDFTDSMVKDGASYLELRAFGQMISSCSDFAVAMSILDKEMKQKDSLTIRKIYRKASRKPK